MNKQFEQTKRQMSPGLKILVMQLAENVMKFSPEKQKQIRNGNFISLVDFCKFYEIDYDAFLKESKISGFINSEGNPTESGLKSGLYSYSPYNETNLN